MSKSLQKNPLDKMFDSPDLALPAGLVGNDLPGTLKIFSERASQSTPAVSEALLAVSALFADIEHTLEPLFTRALRQSSETALMIFLAEFDCAKAFAQELLESANAAIPETEVEISSLLKAASLLNAKLSAALLTVAQGEGSASLSYSAEFWCQVFAALAPSGPAQTDSVVKQLGLAAS